MSSVALQERLNQLQTDLYRNLSEGKNLSQDFFMQAGKMVVEQLLSAEVDAALGREPYERRESDACGYRNGYKTRQLKTGEGRMPVAVPQVRGLAEPYRSRIWEGLGTRSVNLDKMAVEMYARGLSTRDIEDLLKEISGDDKTLLSRSQVSEVAQVLWEEYEAFTKRDLSGFDVVYLFVDAVYESMQKQCGSRQAILVSWGVCSDGAKVLLHVGQGNKESEDCWLEHFRSMVSRGLPLPLTVTSDGAPGCIKAIEAMWPECERIRCWFHKMQNILDKVPDDMRVQIKKLLEDVRDAPDHQTGKQRAEKLMEEYRQQLPGAMACLSDDLEASLNHLKLPSLHQKSIRTTNLVERGFVEERRRAKVIPKFRGERECLKLVFAVLWRASNRWMKVKFTDLERSQLQAYIRVRQAMGKKLRNVLLAA